jgi:hypothetical protein
VVELGLLEVVSETRPVAISMMDVMLEENHLERGGILPKAQSGSIVGME